MYFLIGAFKIFPLFHNLAIFLFSEIVVFMINWWLVLSELFSRCAVVRFCYHSYDFRPNWTPRSPITITYSYNVVAR